MIEAKKLIGQHEIEGDKDNSTIMQCYKECGHPEIKHDETPWCAAFVGAMLYRANLKGTGGLSAREYEGWGVSLKFPIYGCIGVKKRVGSGWVGHVGFVVAVNPQQIVMLGGNQGDAVSVAAFDRSQFTAFRWPKEFKIPYPSLPLPINIKAAKLNVSQS